MPQFIKAPVAGTVLKVQIEEGVRVTGGQVGVIIDSSQGQTPVEIPAPGFVSVVHCSEGAPVHEGDLLVTLD
jgi:biotin carboxyl carrier protein